jgi:hypothetical protein
MKTESASNQSGAGGRPGLRQAVSAAVAAAARAVFRGAARKETAVPPLLVDSPEALASVLARQPAAILFAIPKAIRSAGPGRAAAFLNETGGALSTMGGFETRRQLLTLFMGLLESPGIASLVDLCAYIDNARNVELRKELEWDKAGLDALAVLSGFRLLAGKAAAQRTSGRRAGKGLPRAAIETLSPEDAEIAREWRALRTALRELEESSDARTAQPKRRKLHGQCVARVSRLWYLAFLGPAVLALCGDPPRAETSGRRRS